MDHGLEVRSSCSVVHVIFELRTDMIADSNALPGASADIAEGKTGLSSLVSSSESDWRSRPLQTTQSPWGNNTHIRNAGVSPARKRSVAQDQNTTQFGENSSSLFSV